MAREFFPEMDNPNNIAAAMQDWPTIRFRTSRENNAFLELYAVLQDNVANRCFQLYTHLFNAIPDRVSEDYIQRGNFVNNRALFEGLVSNLESLNIRIQLSLLALSNNATDNQEWIRRQELNIIHFAQITYHWHYSSSQLPVIEAYDLDNSNSIFQEQRFGTNYGIRQIFLDSTLGGHQHIARRYDQLYTLLDKLIAMRFGVMDLGRPENKHVAAHLKFEESLQGIAFAACSYVHTALTTFSRYRY